MGLSWEELEPDRVFPAGKRLVTAEDLRAFGTLTGDLNPLHFDDAAARAAGFHGAVAHGALGVSLATGMLSRLELTRGTLIAVLGLSWRFRAPVHPGDTLSIRVTVVSRAATSRPDRGTVTFAVEVINQRQELVQVGELVELVRRRTP